MDAGISWLSAYLSALCGGNRMRYIRLVSDSVTRVNWLARLARRAPVLPLALGLFLGIFIGVSMRYDAHYDASRHEIHDSDDGSSDNYHVTWRRSNVALPASISRVLLRCVIGVQSQTVHPRKYITAVLDTYGRRCDELLFFTDSEKLVHDFSERTSIFLMEDNHGPSQWVFLRDMLQFVVEHNKDNTVSNSTEAKEGSPAPVTWTVLLNERNFLMVENLRAYLALQFGNVDNFDEAVLVGRLMDIRPSFRFLFPFAHWQSIAFEAGVALSPAALRVLADDNAFCGMSFFAIVPRYSGRALLKCALANKFRIQDPIDEDGHHLFVPWNLRQFFTTPNTSLLDLFVPRHGAPSSKLTSTQRADCCSDHAISFAHLVYTDARVLEFATANMRVFGV